MNEVNASDDDRAQPAPGPGGIEDYACLLDICRGNQQRVADMLWIFARSVRSDREEWEAACQRGDWQTASSLSHRLRSGFHRVDEIAISRKFAEIESCAGAALDRTMLAAMCRELAPQIDEAVAKAEMSARNARKQWN